MSITELLFSFRGRINRAPYWAATLAIIGVLFIVILLVVGVGSVSGTAFIIFAVILYIPAVWIGLALGAKRLHDRNKSAWWLVLFYLVPAGLQGIGGQLDTGGLILTLIGF